MPQSKNPSVFVESGRTASFCQSLDSFSEVRTSSLTHLFIRTFACSDGFSTLAIVMHSERPPEVVDI